MDQDREKNEKPAVTLSDRIIGSMQNAIARSPFAMRIVVKLNNQCRAIIGRLHGATSVDMKRNGESAMIRHLCPSLRVVVDVGANLGEWTQLVLQAAKVEHCLIFEPSLAALAGLERRFAPMSNVTIIAAAAGEAPGNILFYEEAGAGETSSVVRGVSNVESHARSVSVTTLDYEIQERGIERIDYLKIDAEGYDFSVLKGAVRLFEQKRIVAGQFEYGTGWALSGATLQFALRWLESLGYACFLLKEGKLYRPRMEVYGEYFNYSNYVFCELGALPLIQGMIAGAV